MELFQDSSSSYSICGYIPFWLNFAYFYLFSLIIHIRSLSIDLYIDLFILHISLYIQSLKISIFKASTIHISYNLQVLTCNFSVSKGSKYFVISNVIFSYLISYLHSFQI